MPAGLDGNPNPVRTPQRDAVLREVAALVVGHGGGGRPLLVGVDGRSASGKSTFADELAVLLRREHQVVVVRSTTDAFHNEPAVRYRLGRDSAEGYYRDSHDLVALRHRLLDPMRCGHGTYRAAAYDVASETPVDPPGESVPRRSVLVFDGLFLHRPELRQYWDVSVFLDADRRKASTACEHAAAAFAPGGAAAFVSWLEWWARARRYWDGWRIYAEQCGPAGVASMVIDNNDIEHPLVLRGADRVTGVRS